MSILDCLFNRLEASKGDTVAFTASELSAWPSSDLDLLYSEGLITRASASTHTICPGCEEQCSRPVEHVRDGSEVFFFTVCDKRSDTNRVEIDPSDIDTWSCSGSSLAASIARHLDISPANNSTTPNNQLTIGLYRGEKHSSHVLLEFKDQAVINTAGRSTPAAELVWIKQGFLYVDQHRLTAMVDNPVAAAGSEESADKRAERLLARKIQLKSEGVRAFIKKIAAEEGISTQRVRQIISTSEKKKTGVAGWPIPSK